MLSSLLMLALAAATGLAQAPEGYRTVLITSMVNPKFVVVPKAATAGSTLIVKTRNDKPEQHWYVNNGTTAAQIQLAGTKLCFDAGAKSNWKDLGTVSVKECSDTEPAQKWIIMADGRIKLEGSKPEECLDLLYMRATENNPVGLYACAGLGNTGAADKGINWPLVSVTP